MRIMPLAVIDRVLREAKNLSLTDLQERHVAVGFGANRVRENAPNGANSEGVGCCARDSSN
jgi:hypothetical protein